MGKSITVMNDKPQPTATVRRSFLTQIRQQLQEAVKVANDAETLRKDNKKIENSVDYADFKIRVGLSIEQLASFRLPISLDNE